MKTIVENVTLLSTAAIVGLIVSIVAQIFALFAKYIYDLSTEDNIFPFLIIVVNEIEVNTFLFFHVY